MGFDNPWYIFLQVGKEKIARPSVEQKQTIDVLSFTFRLIAQKAKFTVKKGASWNNTVVPR